MYKSATLLLEFLFFFIFLNYFYSFDLPFMHKCLDTYKVQFTYEF